MIKTLKHHNLQINKMISSMLMVPSFWLLAIGLFAMKNWAKLFGLACFNHHSIKSARWKDTLLQLDINGIYQLLF